MREFWDGWDYDIYYNGTVMCWEDLTLEQQAVEKLTNGKWYQLQQLKQRHQKEDSELDFHEWAEGLDLWIDRGLEEDEYNWFDLQDILYEERK